MLKTATLAIGLLTAILVVPSAQASTTVQNTSAIEQPATNLQAQLTILFGEGPAPRPRQATPRSRWEGGDRPEGFSGHNRFRGERRQQFAGHGGQRFGQPGGQRNGQSNSQSGGQSNGQQPSGQSNGQQSGGQSNGQQPNGQSNGQQSGGQSNGQQPGGQNSNFRH
jgi:hypothetical protein